MKKILYNDGIDYKGKMYQKEQPTDWQKERYINKKFGYLLVECPVWVKGLTTLPNNSRAIWLTHCDCGNDYCVSVNAIQKTIKKGNIPNCGCLKRQEQDDKYIGKVYNYLTVIERDDECKKENHFNNTNTYYKCRCICGNIISVRINILTHGDVKSCGCLKKMQEQINLIPKQMRDITGQRFGKLIALSPFKKENDSGFWWHCQCDCGKNVDVRVYSLTNGDTMSCGCLAKRSKGEIQIEKILKEHNINYLHDTTYFKDLKLSNGGIGRYDFILLDENKQPYKLIEYDGAQHYKPCDYFGGEEKFKEQQKNDEIKNEYARTHNLPLVRIPYTEKEITFEKLMS